MSTYINIFKSD